MRIVVPKVWLTSVNAVNSSVAELESSAPVGSSAKISGGRFTIARAAATRCRWPPDNSLGYFFSWESIPNSAASSFTFLSISFAGLCSKVSGTATVYFQGKLIVLENLTPVLSPEEKKKRKREIENNLYDIFSKYGDRFR